jgi:hypothetical protein
MVISAYSPLQWLNQIVPVADIASDNSLAGGESASDVLSLTANRRLYIATPVNSTLGPIYGR